MGDLFNVENEIRARRQSLKKGDPQLAILGDGRGAAASNLYADLQHLWARWVGSQGETQYGGFGAPFRVLAGTNYSPEINMVVWIRYDPRLGYFIERPDVSHLQATNRSSHLLNPLDPHNQFVKQAQILTLVSQPLAATSLKVSVGQWIYRMDDNTVGLFSGTNDSTRPHADLTSAVPGTTAYHRYALVYFDIGNHQASTNPIQVATSTAQSWNTALDSTDIAECLAAMPDNLCIPIKAYRLETGQSGIRGHVDDRDMRQFINAPLVVADGSITVPKLASTALHTATSAPTVNDDSADGYSIGTVWIDTTADKIYVATDVTVGAALWKETSNATGGSGTVMSVGLSTDASYLTIGSTPVTTSGTITANKTTGLAANQVVATPDGSTGAADLRSLVLADLPLSTRASSIIINATAGEAWSARDNVYFDTTSATWFKIDNDAVPILVGTIRGVATASAIISSTTNTIHMHGTLSGYSSLTPGGALYAAGTAGASTQTRPTVSAGGGQVVICEMGTALSATEVFVNPMPLEFLKRESLASNASLTITHISDPHGRARETAGYVASNDITLVETYASSNQDAAAQLKGQSGSGGTTTVDTAGVATVYIGNATGTSERAAQSFQVTAGRLSSMSIGFGTTIGVPTSPPTWSICTDNAGIPSTTVLQSGVMGAITQNADNTITVTNGVYLSASTTYWLVLDVVPIQGANKSFNLLRSITAGYANGVLKWETTATSVFPGTWTLGGGSNDLRCTITTSALSAFDRIAQGVSHSSSCQPTTVNLWLKKTGAPTGNLTASLFSDSGGSPNAVITNGASNTVAASTLTTSYGWITFTFATPPTLSSSTQYHIVLSTSDSASNTNYVEWGIDTSSPSYANGVIKTETSSVWSATPTADGCFELYAITATYDEPVVIGRYSAGTRDVGVRYDDGSGASGDTKTTFKNVSGSTLDVVCAVRME